MSFPLKNKKILVTREKSQIKPFSDLLLERKAKPFEIPLLKIDCLNVKEKLAQLNFQKIEWIFFTSAHGVNCFFSQIIDHSILANCNIATVGHKTELALKKYQFKADFIPSTYNATVMSKEFLEKYPHANNILLVRGNISRKELIEVFSEKQINFETITVYETKFHDEIQETFIQTLNQHRFDFLTFTSPSTVQAFYSFVKEEENVDEFLQIPTVCIGTTTEKYAKELGFQHTFIPETFTIESMVDKMEEIVHMEG